MKRRGDLLSQQEWTLTGTRSSQPLDSDGLPSLADAELVQNRPAHAPSTLVRWKDIMQTRDPRIFTRNQQQRMFVSALQQELCFTRNVSRSPYEPRNRYLFPGKTAHWVERQTIGGILDAVEAYPGVINDIARFYLITPESLKGSSTRMSFGGMLSSLQHLADPDNHLAHVAPHLARNIQRVLTYEGNRSVDQLSRDERRIQKVIDDLFAVTSSRPMARPPRS